MEIPHLHPCFREEIGKIFRHFLGEGCNKHPFMGILPFVDFSQKIIHLSFNGTHFDTRVQKAGRTDNLLRQVCLYPHFIGPRRSRYVNNLVNPLRKFIKGQRPVIQSARQAETVVYQRAFSGLVAVVHGPELGHCHMGFINHNQKIIGEIVKKSVRRLSGLPA